MLNCRRPDRDCPGLRCGHPLPCPWHTVTIDVGKTPPSVEEPVTAWINSRARRAFRLLGRTLKGTPHA